MGKPLKIINFIEDGRLAGGPQRRIATVAKPLYKKGVHTLIIVAKSAETDSYATFLKQHNIDYLRIPLTRPTMVSITLVFKYILLFPIELVRLIRAFSKVKPDLIHVSGGAWQIKGVLAAKLAGSRVLWHLNDTYTPRPLYYLFQFLKGLANGLIVESDRVKQYYRLTDIEQPVYQISPPVDCSRFNPACVQSAKLKHKEMLNVVTVAQIIKIKNLELIIELARILKDKKIIFNIVGPLYSGHVKYMDKLQNMIKDYQIENVIFCGESEQPETFLKAADAYFCSSHSEASPTVVWEAMSMGLPVIATDVSDLRKMTEENNDVDIDVYSKHDLKGLSEAFINLATSTNKVALANRDYVQNKFDLPVTVDRHVSVYRQVLQK